MLEATAPDLASGRSTPSDYSSIGSPPASQAPERLHSSYFCNLRNGLLTAEEELGQKLKALEGLREADKKDTAINELRDPYFRFLRCLERIYDVVGLSSLPRESQEYAELRNFIGERQFHEKLFSELVRPVLDVLCQKATEDESYGLPTVSFFHCFVIWLDHILRPIPGSIHTKYRFPADLEKRWKEMQRDVGAYRRASMEKVDAVKEKFCTHITYKDAEVPIDGIPGRASTWERLMFFWRHNEKDFLFSRTPETRPLPSGVKNPEDPYKIETLNTFDRRLLREVALHNLKEGKYSSRDPTNLPFDTFIDAAEHLALLLDIVSREVLEDLDVWLGEREGASVEIRKKFQAGFERNCRQVRMLSFALLHVYYHLYKDYIGASNENLSSAEAKDADFKSRQDAIHGLELAEKFFATTAGPLLRVYLHPANAARRNNNVVESLGAVAEAEEGMVQVSSRAGGPVGSSTSGGPSGEPRSGSIAGVGSDSGRGIGCLPVGQASDGQDSERSDNKGESHGAQQHTEQEVDGDREVNSAESASSHWSDGILFRIGDQEAGDNAAHLYDPSLNPFLHSAQDVSAICFAFALFLASCNNNSDREGQHEMKEAWRRQCARFIELSEHGSCPVPLKSIDMKGGTKSFWDYSAAFEDVFGESDRFQASFQGGSDGCEARRLYDEAVRYMDAPKASSTLPDHETVFAEKMNRTFMDKDLRADPGCQRVSDVPYGQWIRSNDHVVDLRGDTTSSLFMERMCAANASRVGRSEPKRADDSQNDGRVWTVSTGSEPEIP